MAFFGAPRSSARLGSSHPPGRDLASDTKTFFDREPLRASAQSLPRIYLITRFHVHASFAATAQIPRRPIMQRVCFLSSPLPVSSRRIPLPPAQRLLNRRHTVTFPRKAKVSPSWRFVRGSRRQFTYGPRSQRQLRVSQITKRPSGSASVTCSSVTRQGRPFFQNKVSVLGPLAFANPPPRRLSRRRAFLTPHFTQVAGIRLPPTRSASPRTTRSSTHQRTRFPSAPANAAQIFSAPRSSLARPARAATRSCGGCLLHAQTIVL
ncbi:hypothetical protein EDB84DRAFT_1674651 [Lactarius hengduanensis]|nr:hypothetical protein EDB84DRAFT_1674651 [Lactarius hengduanensis]